MNKKQTLAVCLFSAILLTVGFLGGLVYSQTGGTFYISEGVYPGSVDYTIWREGSNYYAKNAYGRIDYSGTNCSDVIMSCIDNLPSVSVEIVDEAGGGYTREYVTAPHGIIQFSGDNFTIATRLQIPIGSRIALKGQGVSYQAIALGRRGGTRFIGTDSAGILWAMHNSSTVTSSSGSEIRIEDIEFYQQTALSGAGIDVLTLTGMGMGYLKNVVVTSYYQAPTSPMTGYGIRHDPVFGTDDTIIYERVQIAGFQNGFLCYISHLACNGLYISYCNLSMQVWANTDTSFNSVHIFGCNRIIQIDDGMDTFTIRDLFIEQSGNSGSQYSWYCHPNFNSTVQIFNTNVRTGYSNLWTMWNSSYFMFWNVHTSPDSTAFPTVTTPGLVNATWFTVDESQIIEVSIWGGTLQTVEINGGYVGAAWSTYLLFPSDTIRVNMTVVGEWAWRGVSAVQRTNV